MNKNFLPALLCALILSITFPAETSAHGGSDDRAHAHKIPVSVESAKVEITEQGSYRLIKSNGIPDHETGAFPNRNNPNAISAQDYDYRIPLKPEKARKVTDLNNRMHFGVALNGVPFDPGTAEYFHNDPRSGWVLEAISGRRDLGLDSSNAHVQPDGAYHYHGIPWGMLKHFDRYSGDDMMLVGYAADGYSIYMPVEPGTGYRPSYRVKGGTRTSGPGGLHDGSFTQDWEYVGGYGDLDECNGRVLLGGYAYVLTEQFPFVPRCFKGAPDRSFNKRPSGSGGGSRPSPRPN